MLEINSCLSPIRKQNAARNCLFSRELFQKSSWPLQNDLMSLTSGAVRAALYCFWTLEGFGSEYWRVPHQAWRKCLCTVLTLATEDSVTFKKGTGCAEIIKNGPLDDCFRMNPVWERHHLPLSPFYSWLKMASCGFLNCNIRNGAYSYRKIF